MTQSARGAAVLKLQARMCAHWEAHDEHIGTPRGGTPLGDDRGSAATPPMQRARYASPGTSATAEFGLAELTAMYEGVRASVVSNAALMQWREVYAIPAAASAKRDDAPFEARNSAQLFVQDEVLTLLGVESAHAEFVHTTAKVWMIKCTVTLCANPANDLTCPPLIHYNFKTIVSWQSALGWKRDWIAAGASFCGTARASRRECRGTEGATAARR